MAIENLIDSYYTLSVGTESESVAKVPHLQKCDPPTSEKYLDEVTATDDRRTVKAVVDFAESSEIEFEYVLDTKAETHTQIQTAYDAGTDLTWQFTFVNAPKLSREFTGMVSKLTPSTEDTKQKVRMTGTITITSEPKPIEE